MVTRRRFGLGALTAGLFASSSVLAKARARQPEPLLSIAARSPYVSYEGRTADMRDAEGAAFVRASFPGVVLRVKFEASKLSARTLATSENVLIDVSVDGGAPRLVHLSSGQQDLTLYEGIAGAHRVEITRRTESWEGQWDIVSFAIDNGRFLPADSLSTKKLMFIGDSITCGAGCDVSRDDQRQDMTINNAAKSFGKVLAKTLGTQCHLVSYGGRGVYRDWQGIEAINNAPQFYDRAAPDEPTLLWDAQNYVPDAIGICLGTNDFNQGIPDQNAFINAYVEFLSKIRRDAPHAVIFVLNSPMLTDADMPKRLVCSYYLDEIVKRAGSANVKRIAIQHYPGRSSNSHPIAEEHVAIARELEPFFRAALG